jgi:hypothetical protein
MASNHEILLSGAVSEKEVEEIKSIISEENVFKMEVKGYVLQDLIQIVFNDLNIITFSRDFILGAVVTGGLTKIKSIINYFRQRNKKVKRIKIELQIKSDNKEFTLTILSEPDDIDILIELTNDQMKNVVDKAENTCIMQVKLSELGKKLEISKI